MAHAAGLNRDGDGRHHSAFEANMRRRIWWQLLVLDVRASEDRGLEPIIQDSSYNTEPPSNMNDEDCSFTSKHPLTSKATITDMCFSVITMDASSTYLKINHVPARDNAHVLSQAEKERLVTECTNRIKNIYLAGADMANPQHWLASMMGRLMSLKLWLALQYPLQARTAPTTPGPPSPGFPHRRCLQTAIAYLQLSSAIMRDERARPHLWLFRTIVPWHALAVALAELCTETTGDAADEAWEVIDDGYQSWSEEMAESKDGLLWKPIRRLHKRAMEARERDLAALNSLNSSAPLHASPSALDNLPGLKLEAEAQMTYMVPEHLGQHALHFQPDAQQAFVHAAFAPAATPQYSTMEHHPDPTPASAQLHPASLARYPEHPNAMSVGAGLPMAPQTPYLPPNQGLPAHHGQAYPRPEWDHWNNFVSDIDSRALDEEQYAHGSEGFPMGAAAPYAPIHTPPVAHQLHPSLAMSYAAHSAGAAAVAGMPVPGQYWHIE